MNRFLESKLGQKAFFVMMWLMFLGLGSAFLTDIFNVESIYIIIAFSIINSIIALILANKVCKAIYEGLPE